MNRNYSFDALRGLASFLVVAYHVGKIGITYVPAGFLAVDFFFVLSGYVIAAAYERRLQEGLTVRRFALIRLVRLYPLALFGSLVGLARIIGSLLIQQQDGWLDSFGLAIPLNLLLLPVLLPVPEIFILNPPIWSLFFELVANGLFATITIRFANWGLALVVLVSGILFFYLASRNGDPVLGWSWGTFVGGLFRVSYGFVAGQLLFRLRRIFPVIRQSYLAFLPFALLSVILVAPIQGYSQTLYWNLSAIFMPPALIALALVLELPGRFHNLALFLGNISYPLYVVHFPLLLILAFVFRRYHVPVTSYGLIALPMITVIAFAAEKLVDLPVRRWLTIKLGLGRNG